MAGYMTPVRSKIDSWASLKEASARGYKDAIEASSLAGVIQRGNCPLVFSGLQSSNAGKAAELLVIAGIARLVLFATRDLSPVRSSDLSFGAVEKFLSRHDFANESFDAAILNEALSIFSAYKNDVTTKKLKTYRDKFIAHPSGTSQELPNYNELFACVKTTVDIWEKLAIGIGVFSMPVSNHAEAFINSGEIFWSKWEP